MTRRGIETAVLVPIGIWQRLRQAVRPGLRDLLLAAEPRFEELAPERGRLRRHSPVRLA